MPFSHEKRLWILRAYGNGDITQARCQFPSYSENKGFHLNCNVFGEKLFVVRWSVEEWGTTGIPFCQNHFETLYPEIATATHNYRDDKESFKKLIPYSESNRTRIGDWATDLYYFQQNQEIIYRYAITHPKDKLP